MLGNGNFSLALVLVCKYDAFRGGWYCLTPSLHLYHLRITCMVLLSVNSFILDIIKHLSYMLIRNLIFKLTIWNLIGMKGTLWFCFFDLIRHDGNHALSINFWYEIPPIECCRRLLFQRNNKNHDLSFETARVLLLLKISLVKTKMKESRV